MNKKAHLENAVKYILDHLLKLHYFLSSLFSPKYTHIYIDESVCEKAGLATLTAIFFPQKKLKSISIEFYRIIRQIIDKFPEKENNSRIIYSAPVLHGNSLLRKNDKKDLENGTLDFSKIDDDFRIEVFQGIIDIIVRHKLRIVRLGYNNYDELLKMKYKDEKMYNLNWIALSTFIDRSYNVRKAICVMEGNYIGMIHAFSRFLSSSKTYSYVYPDLEKSLVYNDCRKFIGNVFYVPARYCEYLQIVDLISYILHKKDYMDITGETSEFSQKIYNLNHLLKDNVDYNNLVTLKTDWVPPKK